MLPFPYFFSLRNINVDEELGGMKGMKLFVQTPEFKKLNVGFGLDEGKLNLCWSWSTPSFNNSANNNKLHP